jgi:hypothetical protein
LLAGQAQASVAAFASALKSELTSAMQTRRPLKPSRCVQPRRQ